MRDHGAIPGNPGGPRTDWTALLDSLALGVILADGTGRLGQANPAAARILGLDRDALLALSLDRLQARLAPAPQACAWTRDSGETILLTWSEEALPDGGVLVSLEDITATRAQAARLERLTRLYAALSQVNQAIVWTASRQALLDKICEVMVVFGKFTTAWIGLDNPATHVVEVASRCGDSENVLADVQVRSDDSALGRGGVGSSIREGRPHVINDFQGTPAQGPWYAIATRGRFASMASFPFRENGRVSGALTVYASEKDYFGPDEIALLEEAASDLAFALEHLELDARRVSAERELEHAQASVTALIESTRDLIWSVDREQRLLICNSAVVDYFRTSYGTTARPGATAADLLPPDRAGMWGPLYQRVFAEGAFAQEIDLRDGHTLEVALHPILGERGVMGASVFAKDITERKRAEELLRESLESNRKLLQASTVAEAALRESEASYRGLFESVGEAIFIQDRSGRFLDVNRGAAELHGVTREELIGLDPRKMAAPGRNDLAEVMTRLERAFAGEPQVFEFWGTRLGGEPFLLEERLYPGFYFGQEVVIAMSRDITENKRAEEAQRQAQKLESLGVLAGGIAHDFNNLLTAIMGNLNLGQAAVGEYSPARPYLEKVENTVLKAAELSRQMLAYSGKGHFVVKPRDLNAIIREMTGLLAASLPKKIRLDLQLAPDLPLFKADGAQIQQVVMNLITNAADAVGGQEGRISITTFNADLDREVLTNGFPGQPMEAGNYIVLSVADSGSGMRPEVLSRIFDPFFTTKAAGRGLGLSAMLGILKGHKAGIRIATEVGRGSTFEVFFPTLEARELVEDPAPSRRERRLAGTVLLVDDEEIILETTAQALESLGFRVVKARDGAHALEQFQDLGQDLVLVFMDLSMPRMDGTSAFQAMHRARPEVPVVLTSGYDQKEATEDLLAQGLAGFIQKPYRIRDLARELDRILTGPVRS